MGKVNSEPSSQSPNSHFSHPHPLQFSNLQSSSLICSACKIQASGPVYICTPCNFILHPKCYELPKKIKHEFHTAHTLHLQTKPVYPDGLFKCDACGNPGDGFSYHCSPCGIDLHTSCASLPMQLLHHSHQHQLNLNFSSPYPGNSFSCDICKGVSSNTWLYRCSSTCEFDAHVTCVKPIASNPSTFHSRVGPPGTARSVPEPSTNLYHPSNSGNFGPPPPLQAAYPPNNGLYAQPQTAYPPNTGTYGHPPPPQAAGFVPSQNQFVSTPYPATAMPQIPSYNNYSQPAAYGASQTPANNGLRDQLMVGAVNGVASGVSQSATQALIQGLFAGGGGGGGGGGDVSHVGVMGASGATVDGGSYYDGGYGGTDGGYNGGDGQYYY